MVSPIKQYAPLDMTDGNRIVNLGAPVLSSDAATKGYVDAKVPIAANGDTLYYHSTGGAVVSTQAGPYTGTYMGALVSGLPTGHRIKVDFVGKCTGGVAKAGVTTFLSNGSAVASTNDPAGDLAGSDTARSITVTLTLGATGIQLFVNGAWSEASKITHDIVYTDLDVGAPAVLPIGNEGDHYEVVSGVPAWVAPTPVTGKIEIGLDGHGAVPSTGVRADLVVPFGLTITGWTVIADVAGDLQIDIWKSTLAAYPPTVGGTITGSDKPRLSGALSASSSALTGWTKALSGGDVLRINLDSASTLTRATVVLAYTKA